MKKILLMFFSLFLCLFVFDNVKAETKCSYDTNYGIIKIKFESKNVSKIYFQIKNGNEILWNKSHNINFNNTCPDDISVIYDNNKLWVYANNFKSLGKVNQFYKIDGVSKNIDSCKYINDDIYIYVSNENATTIQPVVISTLISSFPELEKTHTQSNAYVDFGAGECPDNINVKVFGWDENSNILGGNRFLVFASQDVSYHINSEIKRTLITKVSCGAGEGMITDIPAKIPELTSMMFTIVQVAVPIILVIMGSLDLFKGITSGKEDEMKKGRQMFIKRLVVGAIIFLVVIIVKLIISVVADTGVANMVDCIDCFISNDCGGM